MDITVNGATTQVAEGTTIAALVAAHTGRDLGPDHQPLDGRRLAMAVAVDDAILPRHAWGEPLRAGARVDLVTAVQGG